MKKFFVYILPVILMSLALCACEDEIPFDGGEIPEGTSRISATLTFETFEPTLESRAAGNAMRQINDLWLVIFSGDELFRKERVDLSKATISQVTNSRPDTDEHCTEQTTRVEFEYTVPNGRYRIYAVANVDLSDKDIRTQGDLQHIRLVWNNDPGQINSNAQMIGYFTADRNGGTASFSTVSGDEKTGYEETGALDADEITVR
ncbi:MAG: hypothetical protein K2F79_00285, partial [Muribaculaceae bacterium]|nr:hypothetical protein [Muribaculaceae bacterium]